LQALSGYVPAIAFAPLLMAADGLRVDADFPGGNVIVEGIEGDTVSVRQDLRDTEGDWFHWSFRVRGGGGREIEYRFTRGDVIGVHGPAVSLDEGKTWSWLGRDRVDGASFRHAFPADAAEVRFAFAMPYLQSHLEEFLARHAGSPHLRVETLCKTREGRRVERLHVGRIDGRAEHRALLTCRHHACESMASWCLEGIIETVIAGGDGDPGAWLREHVEILAIPFVDKDGVERGDQGKNRKPHDHNRDYAGESIYPSVEAIRELVPEWSEGILRVALDLHCPWIRGGRNERVSLVGPPSEGVWKEIERFSYCLEVFGEGGLPYDAADNLPFGKEWNVSTGPLMSFSRWASELPGVWVATTLELPYANARGFVNSAPTEDDVPVEVNPSTARALGRDIARALRVYLRDQPPKAYVDRSRRLVVDGEPFFPLGWYSDGDPAKLDRLEGTPFNSVLDYGMTGRPVEETRAYLDAAEARGIKVIFCLNDVYPSATHRERLGEWEGNDAILRGVVSTFRDHPALVAWYNNDELPVEKVPEIEGYYREIASLDRAHPQLLVHYRAGSWRAFLEAADIIGLDNYPIPRSPAAALGDALRAARGEIADRKPVWAVIQSFAWYQHREPAQHVVPGDRDTPRARLPTPEEWDAGRPPTREELRAMTYLALVEGARGILYWCLYNLDYLPDRAERWADAVGVAREVETLFPALLAPEGETVETVAASDSAIRAIRRRDEGEGRVYVIAVNASPLPLRVSLDIVPLAAEPPSGAAGDASAKADALEVRTAEVLFEGRSVPVREGKITDFFPPLGRHVYALGGTDD
jgi:hypothetical protein